MKSELNRYRIVLSFFSLCNQDFEFSVYRDLREKNERKEDFPDCKERNLPRIPLTETKGKNAKPPYQAYWVSYTKRDRFEPFICTKGAYDRTSEFDGTQHTVS
jgi:hypothetical protein